MQAQRHGFQGPVIGPKPTEKNVREFSEEQLRAGKTIIGLQVGTVCRTASMRLRVDVYIRVLLRYTLSHIVLGFSVI